MAILKHVTNKSGNYGKALEYLIFQHNEFTQKPVLDSNGSMQLREEYILEGLNCQPLTFAKECEILNSEYHKNQGKNEIKAHHYIISFDPEDVKAGLTGEKAQQIGIEFAKKYFDGHQALVCTHMDGHNKSGNIHVHIIFNSLRKYDVEHQDFMERDYDSRAGYKHHQTRKYLTAMQEGLMTICEREHLHQVDLLSLAQDKVSDREYRKNQRERRHSLSDSRDARDSAATGKKTRSDFQSQKDYLRSAIREVAAYAGSAEEFGEELKKYYGIQFKVSRSRFSYLHPDRQKYMTGRMLGSAYTEDYLLPILDGNRQIGRTREEPIADNRSIKKQAKDSHSYKSKQPQEYDPSYDYTSNPVAVLHFHTRLRLVVDLQTCAKAQLSRAYARKVKLSNLQQMAQTICFVQEHGIDTQDELESLCSSTQQKLANLQKQDPSYATLRRQTRELQIVLSNVDAILHSGAQYQNRSTEKAQSIE